MNYVDIILIFLLFLTFAIGWKFRGIFLIIIPVAFFTGILFANILYLPFSNFLIKIILNETKRILISYTLVFLIVSSIIVFAGITVARFFDFFKLTFLDRALGAVILIAITIVPIYFGLTFCANLKIFEFIHLKESLSSSIVFPVIEKYVFLIIKLPVLKQLSVINNILQ